MDVPSATVPPVTEIVTVWPAGSAVTLQGKAPALQLAVQVRCAGQPGTLPGAIPTVSPTRAAGSVSATDTLRAQLDAPVFWIVTVYASPVPSSTGSGLSTMDT